MKTWYNFNYLSQGQLYFQAFRDLYQLSLSLFLYYYFYLFYHNNYLLLFYYIIYIFFQTLNFIL